MTTFTRAIVRAPAPNFSSGLTTSKLGPPDYELAVSQHRAYCTALEKCCLTLTYLPPEETFPDSTFIEDTAVLTERGAILARPGAPSRSHEVRSVRELLVNLYQSIHSIDSPGTLDGGDVLQADDQFFIGVSGRTNEAGAEQLANVLKSLGYRPTLIDISTSAILHLKSGIAYLGDNRLVVTHEFRQRDEFLAFEIVNVDEKEGYAANCVRVNDHILIASGYAGFASTLYSMGYQTIELDMSEFEKMDGGLSCLSLRF